jgi:hypothetical protein
MVDVLVTTRVVKPGVYIGRINRPTPTGLTGFVRLPNYVGKGSRLRTVFNSPIRRSYLNDVAVTFPNTSPHLVALAQPALPDQNVAQLFDSNGRIVPSSKWRFLESTPGSGIFNQVLLLPEAFQIGVTYQLSYQSTSRTIRDELPFDEIREVRFIGDTENQERYEEFVHFYIPISITAPTAAATNDASAATDLGFQPAQITGTAAGPFAFAGGEILNVTINGNAHVVTFVVGATTTAASAAAQINAVISADGIAIVETGDFITIRSLSYLPGTSSVLVAAGTANAILGTTGAQFPTAAMVTATFTTAGFARRIDAGVNSLFMGVQAASTSAHLYNRRYRITLGAPVAGDIPATVDVIQDSGSSIPAVVSGAAITAAQLVGASSVGVAPQLPLHTDLETAAAALTGTKIEFTLGDGFTVTASFTDITGDTVVFILDDSAGPANVVGGEIFEVSSVGPAAIQVDSAVLNTVQHNSFSAVGSGLVTNAGTPSWGVSIGGAAAGDGLPSLRANAAFTGTHNKRYLLVCTASGGGVGARTASFAWQGWGEVGDLEHEGATRTFTIAEATGTNNNVNLGNGVLLDFAFDSGGGAGNFSVDDAFWFQANADRVYITAKDDRSYVVDVASVSATGAVNNVSVQYQTGTPEGGFDLVATTGAAGELALPGNVLLWLRNIGSQTTAANRFALNDQWTFDTVNDDVVDWSLTVRTSETIDVATQLFTDTLGVITGTAGLRYVILSNVPTSILYIMDTVTGALITTFSTFPGTPHVAFSTAPTNAITIAYEHIGLEPAPSALYNVTANIVREATLYDTPIRVLSFEEAQNLLGPSATTNDLMIAAELALEDNNAFGAYFTQAFDSDGDGVITTLDINQAIASSEDTRALTDVIVLNSFASLSSALENNEKMNDPFERGERALWVGTPVGTLIGDEDTAGTLVFLARRSLQVFGNNPAHGTRVLVANNQATKTIELTDGTQVSVTLDGSFIAAAIAARNASFDDPGETLLRKNLFGFDTMEVFTEPEELQLVAASIIWCSNQGSVDVPVFRIEESTTVDRSSDDNNEISVAINQKQFVTREVRESMDGALVGIVPPSEQAGVAIVQTFLVEKLISLVSRGIIGPYQDDSGSDRPIDPNVDVEVFRARDSRTLYHFKYFWFGRYPIKRLFGLFSVDRKFFGQQV